MLGSTLCKRLKLKFTRIPCFIVFHYYVRMEAAIKLDFSNCIKLTNSLLLIMVRAECFKLSYLKLHIWKTLAQIYLIWVTITIIYCIFKRVRSKYFQRFHYEEMMFKETNLFSLMKPYNTCYQISIYKSTKCRFQRKKSSLNHRALLISSLVY